jgi:hypothetical protein
VRGPAPAVLTLLDSPSLLPLAPKKHGGDEP